MQQDSTGKYTHGHNAIIRKTEEKETNVSDKKCYQQSVMKMQREMSLM